MSAELAQLLEAVEVVHSDLSKVVFLVEGGQVPLYEMGTVLDTVARLADQVAARARAARAETARVCGEAAPGPVAAEAGRKYLNTLLTSQLLAGGDA
ncbi:hypothetical protein KDK95_33745 [Actinospica sp. MGRD01-02]|uniref:Uncharacterized protein n=1 Tax=Actinospica acidithermotolerans TaxID=2828514 RepID=A0A941EGZ7_9ACTN|nr:hypothetical protein [Actinospica acidithermotolerans]MBR7831317.1 hypothetical protein [Actinospica acidithermotolerans]